MPETLELEVNTLLQQEQPQKVIPLMETYAKAGRMISDTLYYLWGNAYRKLGDFPKAMEMYSNAVRLNPSGPAKHALSAAGKVMAFHDENMFNQ